MKRLWSAWVAVALALFVVDPAVAAEFASQPVHIVVPFPPVGGTDVVARVIAERLTPVLTTDIDAINAAYGLALPYDSLKDFAFVAQLTTSPLILGFEWFKRMAGIDILDVPRKAGGQALVRRDIDRYRHIIALTGARPE